MSRRKLSAVDNAALNRATLSRRIPSDAGGGRTQLTLIRNAPIPTTRRKKGGR